MDYPKDWYEETLTELQALMKSDRAAAEASFKLHQSHAQTAWHQGESPKEAARSIHNAAVLIRKMMTLIQKGCLPFMILMIIIIVLVLIL
jgi:hypothetical protein